MVQFRKRNVLLAITVITGITILAGCDASDSGSGSDGGTGNILETYVSKMKQCTPSLEQSISPAIKSRINASITSVQSAWKNGDNGWNPTAEYGVLNKHLNPESGSESVYGAANLLDRVIENINEVYERLGNSGTSSEGSWTVTIEKPDGGIRPGLPAILGISTQPVFDYRFTMTDSDSGQSVKVVFTSHTNDQTILFYTDSPIKLPQNEHHESYLIYAYMNKSTGELSIRSANVKMDGAAPSSGSAHIDDIFRMKVIYDGNYFTKDFKFSIKTDASQGWGIISGGSLLNGSSKFAMARSEYFDSETYANDAAGLSGGSVPSQDGYVIISVNQMLNAGSPGGLDEDSLGWPKDLDEINTSETLPEKRFIDVNDSECAPIVYYYPENHSELIVNGL
ncbi:MAG: hypothetical protein JW982_08395 [Spirochaetes bacterium]|nr:hypothetical protein [Spirochaetota bacterium]